MTTDHDAAIANVMPRYIEIMNREDGCGKYHAATRHYAFVIPLLTEEIERLQHINASLRERTDG